ATASASSAIMSSTNFQFLVVVLPISLSDAPSSNAASCHRCFGEVYDSGHRFFGENYVQELVEKKLLRICLEWNNNIEEGSTHVGYWR
ncbi:hypothetical protein PIB30_085131, partial [Stylosanthes scabra]|nr:hypothetical protein [Stylosanthes scabra]